MIKSLQWNVGGFRIRDHKADPTSPDSYTKEDIDYFIDKITYFNADLITLQETHTNKTKNLVKVIAEKSGYKYYFNDVYDDSHLDSSFKLGQAIISKYPLDNHQFMYFHNPKYEAVWNGNKVISHNKGLSRCSVKINSINLSISTLHAVPFRPFDVNPLSDKAKDVRIDMQRKILSSLSEHSLIQGDFNINEKSLVEFLDNSLHGLNEAIQDRPTTPKGKYYDHIIYKGLDLVESTSDEKVLTDHFPVISTFEVH